MEEKKHVPGKTIVLISNGQKNPDNIHITDEWRERIRKNGLTGLCLVANKVHPGTELIRTHETVQQHFDWAAENGQSITWLDTPPEARLGSDYIHNSMNDPRYRFKEFRELGMTEYKAWKLSAPKEEFDKIVNEFIDALYDIADMLNPGDICIVPSHTPMIEAVAIRILGIEDMKPDLRLKPTTGFALFKADGEKNFTFGSLNHK